MTKYTAIFLIDNISLFMTFTNHYIQESICNFILLLKFILIIIFEILLITLI